MNYQYLYEFVTLAEELHFRQAAARLNISQSTLSAHLQDLEADLRTQLLERNRRRVILTPAGAALVTEARAALQQVDQAGRLASRLSVNTTRAHIGHSGILALPILERALPTLVEQHPSIDIRLIEGSADQLVDQLRRRHIDLAIVRPPLHDAEIDEEYLADENLAIVVWSEHPLADRQDLTVEDLADETFILPPPSAATGPYERHVTALRNRQVILGRSREGGSIDSLLVLVRAKLGITLLPTRATHRLQGQDLRAIPLHGVELALPVHLAWRKADTNPTLFNIRKILLHAAADLPVPPDTLPPSFAPA